MAILLLEHPRIASDAHYHDVANAPLHACLMSGYIAALLRAHGFEAALYDAYLAADSFEQTYADLRAADCSLLGVHAVYFWEHTPALLGFLRRLKKALPDIPIVLYGIFPTFAGGYLLREHSCIDGIVCGEPEHTFLEVARAVAAGKPLAKESIAGFHVKGRQACGPRPLIEPLDVLPFPMRHAASLRVIGGSILGSRGCCGACSFCCINPFYGNGSRWRGRSPDNIGAEVARMLPLLEEKYIYFLDADFFGPPAGRAARAAAIADRLKEYGLGFGLEARAGVFDRPMIVQLAAAGLRDVFLGIESGSARSLARMNKPMCLPDARAAVRLLRDHGINVTPGFIMFEADCTLDDVRENFSFLEAEGLLADLSHTANVLYHREICLASMPRFGRMRAEGRFSGFDETGYEGYYRFIDPRVQFLADIMSRVCREVLKMTEQKTSPLWWRAGDRAAKARVNEYLIAFFREQVGRLSRDTMPGDESERRSIEEKALGDIQGLEHAVSQTCAA